jgi:hypothetical protein
MYKATVNQVHELHKHRNCGMAKPKHSLNSWAAKSSLQNMNHAPTNFELSGAKG